MIDIDAELANADWPKRTPDRLSDLRPSAGVRSMPGAGPPTAILAPDASDDELEAFVAALRGERRHLSGQHDQKTHGHGTISPTAGDVVPMKKGKPDRSRLLTDDPTRMDNLDPLLQQKMRGQLYDFASSDPDKRPGPPLHATEEDLRANIREQLEAGLANPKAAAGKDWYDEAGKRADELSAETGVSRETAVGMIAGQSPQHEWGSNVATAKYTAEALKANKRVKLSPEDEQFVRDELKRSKLKWADGESHFDMDPGPINGKRLSDLDPVVAASVIKTQAKAAGLQYRDDVTGELKGCTWSCGLAGVRTSVEIYRGGSPDEVLSGHKVRSFYNNINAGTGNSGGSVTIDTHAVSAALGQKITSQDPRMGAIMDVPSNTDYGVKGCYPVIADAYRAVAAEYDMPVDSVQAIVWLQWRETHP